MELASAALLLTMSGAPWVGPISTLDNPAEFSTLAVIPSGEYHTFVVGNAAQCIVEAPQGVETEVFVVKCYPKYLFGKWRLRSFYMPTREQHEPTGIWAVRFKATLPEGKHKIIIHTAAEDSKEHPLVEYAFTVTDVEIPPADIPFGMYYDSFRIPTEYFNDQYEDAYFRDMAEHGMNTATVYTWNNKRNMGDDDQVRQFRLMQKYGMAKFPVMLLEWMLNTPVAEIDGTNFMLYGPDEPGPQNKAECEKAYADARKMGMRNVTALSPQSAWLFGKLFDVWIVHIDGVTPSLHQYAKENDAELWMYNSVLRGTNPKLHRYYFGLYTWAVGAKGSFIWAYTHDRTSLLSPDGAWSAKMAFEHVLPTSEGPMSTVGWEGLREGVLDYRIIRALEKTVAKGGSKDENTAKAALWLARLRHSVDPKFFGDAPHTGYHWDLVDTCDPGVDLDKMRAEAIELLAD